MDQCPNQDNQRQPNNLEIDPQIVQDSCNRLQVDNIEQFMGCVGATVNDSMIANEVNACEYPSAQTQIFYDILESA